VAWRGIGVPGAQLGDYYWEPVWELVLLQGVATLALGFLATWAVRRVHLREAGKAPAKQQKSILPVRRLKLGNYPMIWKERVAARLSGKVGIAARIATWLIALGVLVPSVYWSLAMPGNASAGLSVFTANFIACLGLLVLATRAAGAITSEKEKDTWVTLLSTPLSAGEIIVGKLVGSLYSLRGVVVVLSILWALQILRAPQLLVALPFTLGTLAVAGFFAATLGLNYSLRSTNSTRAMGATLATALFVAGGYLFCCVPLMIGGVGGELMFAPCIPFLVTFPSIAAIEGGSGIPRESALYAAYLFGVVGYMFAGFILHATIVSQFDEKNGRIPG
jgi:ABC-type transport system involved in multi-copper enzyme maturation permease subunit